MSDERLLTVREVAQRVGRSEETVRRWIWSGKLPARKLGNQHFVAPEELNNLVAPRVAEPRVAYQASRVSDKPPLSSNHWPYDKEQKLRELAEDVEFGRRLYEKYGYFDAAAAIRENREDDDDD